MGLAIRLVDLLPEEMKGGQDLGPRMVGVKFHIVTNAVGGEEAINAARLEQFPAHNFAQQRLSIGEQLASFFAVPRMVQDRWVAPAQFPGVEEWRPIDKRDKGGDGNGVGLGVHTAPFGVLRTAPCTHIR